MSCTFVYAYRPERKTYQDYIQHLNESHVDGQIKIQTVTCHSKEEFEELRSTLEKDSKCPLVVRTSNEKYKEYICNRSRDYREKVPLKDRKREPNLSKLKKDYTCPTFLKLRIEDGIYKVTYCNFHTHDEQSHFFHMNEETRQRIEQKLRLGIEVKEVLRQTRNENPDFLVTTKDIQNVKQLRHIGDISYDQNDKLSCRNINSLLVQNYKYSFTKSFKCLNQH